MIEEFSKRNKNKFPHIKLFNRLCGKSKKERYRGEDEGKIVWSLNTMLCQKLLNLSINLHCKKAQWRAKKSSKCEIILLEKHIRHVCLDACEE